MNSQATTRIKLKFTAFIVISLVMVIAHFEAIGNTEAPSAAAVNIDGFNFQIDHVVWLADQMDHGIRYPMPQSMMPDMPAHGIRRLSIDITIFNESLKHQLFNAGEVQLSIAEDKSLAASSTTFNELLLNSGQLAHLVLQFDIVPAEHQKLRLIWRRGGKEHAIMMIPQPPKVRAFHSGIHDHH